MPHVIITGPESSGKSTLSRYLAEKLGGLYVPEYPRIFLEAAGRKAVAADFEYFVTINNHLVERALEQNYPVVIQDTGLEVLYVWQRDKFPKVSHEALLQALQEQGPDSYLLCHPDLPWAPDPLREDPHRRQELFEEYQTLLSKTGVPVIDVRGTEGREQRAADHVRSLLGRHG